MGPLFKSSLTDFVLGDSAHIFPQDPNFSFSEYSSWKRVVNLPSGSIPYGHNTTLHADCSRLSCAVPEEHPEDRNAHSWTELPFGAVR